MYVFSIEVEIRTRGLVGTKVNKSSDYTFKLHCLQLIMIPDYLLKGIIIGFSIAAPVGPIGVLTIKRTLAEGRLAGFVTGMGAAMADVFYGAVAGFGLTAISSFLTAQSVWLKMAGGVFLIYLGLRSFFSKPAPEGASVQSKGLLSHFLSTILLTVTSPATIISYIAIFAGFGVGLAGANYTASSALVVGVFAGSALWWLILSTGVGLLRSYVTPEKLVWVNRFSGILLGAFGVWALYSGVVQAFFTTHCPGE